MRDICRTCSRLADPATSRNLFETSSGSLIRQIQTLTSLLLIDDTDLPSLICKQCQHDLQIAIDFRRVCIEAQELLQLKTFADKDDETVLEFGNENDIELMPGSHYEIDEMSEVPTEAQEAAAELSEYESADGLLELPVGVADTSGFPSDYIEFDEELGLSSDSDSPQQPLDDRESSDISCSSCGLGFDTLEDLRTHKYQLHDVSRNTRFVCDHCGEGFRSAGGLTKHCNAIKIPLTHECAKCSGKFHSQILLETHTERCQKPPVPPLHICHICGRQLANASNLKNHLVRHSGIRSHKCTLCDGAFALAAELNSHMKMHTAERPYSCRYYCGKSFRYCSARSIHERIHMDASKRPYRCEYCPKAFVTPSDCRAHQKHHNQNRDHSCEICHSSFKQLKHYQAHLKSTTHKVLVVREGAKARVRAKAIVRQENSNCS